MKDLALHIFDLVENSVKAGATHLQISLVMSGTTLRLKLQDNGPGFPAKIIDSVTDPFTTTRTERPVGLGLSLMRESTTQTGGNLTVANADTGGAMVSVVLIPSHIDARPLGDFPGCITDILTAWPKLDITLLAGTADDVKEILSSHDIKADMTEEEFSHPSIRRFIENHLTTELKPLTDWYAGQQANALQADGIDINSTTRKV